MMLMLRIPVAILAYSVAASAQTCDPPARIPPSGTTIFSEAQDVWLGEAAAAVRERNLRVFRRPGLTSYLDDIASRLTKHLPANEFRFTFSLIELNEATAFVFPGGKAYVTRKLVAFVESEDELAGVIAHEMGTRWRGMLRWRSRSD